MSVRNEIITNHFPIGHESPETVKTHLFESDDCKKSPVELFQHENWVGYSNEMDIHELDQRVKGSMEIDGKDYPRCYFEQAEVKIKSPQLFDSKLIQVLSRHRRLIGSSSNNSTDILSESSIKIPTIPTIPTATMVVNNVMVPMHNGAVVKQVDNQTNVTDVWVLVSDFYFHNYLGNVASLHLGFVIPMLERLFEPIEFKKLDKEYVRAYLIYSSSQNCSNPDLENYAKLIDSNPNLTQPLFYLNPCDKPATPHLLKAPEICPELDHFTKPFITPEGKVGGLAFVYPTKFKIFKPKYGVVCHNITQVGTYIQSSKTWGMSLGINATRRGQLSDIGCSDRPFFQEGDIDQPNNITNQSWFNQSNVKAINGSSPVDNTQEPPSFMRDVGLGLGGLAFLFLIIALLKKKYELINFRNKAHTPQNVELAEQPGRV